MSDTTDYGFLLLCVGTYIQRSQIHALLNFFIGGQLLKRVSKLTVHEDEQE